MPSFPHTLTLVQIRQKADAWATTTGKDQLLALRQAEYWFDSRRYVERSTDALVTYLTAVFESDDPEGARPASLKRGPKRQRPLLHFPYAIKKRPAIDAGDIIMGDTIADIDPNDPPLFDLEPSKVDVQSADQQKKLLEQAKIRHELCIRVAEFLEEQDAPSVLHREQLQALKKVMLHQADLAVSKAILCSRLLSTPI